MKTIPFVIAALIALPASAQTYQGSKDVASQEKGVALMSKMLNNAAKSEAVYQGELATQGMKDLLLRSRDVAEMKNAIVTKNEARVERLIEERTADRSAEAAFDAKLRKASVMFKLNAQSDPVADRVLGEIKSAMNAFGLEQVGVGDLGSRLAQSAKEASMAEKNAAELQKQADEMNKQATETAPDHKNEKPRNDPASQKNTKDDLRALKSI